MQKVEVNMSHHKKLENEVEQDLEAIRVKASRYRLKWLSEQTGIAENTLYAWLKGEYVKCPKWNHVEMIRRVMNEDE